MCQVVAPHSGDLRSSANHCTVNESSSTQPTDHPDQGGRILVLEPDENLAAQILLALREAAPSAHVDLASSLEKAQRLVVNDRPDLFVLDVDAVQDLGQEFLYDLRTSHPHARAIVLTGVHLAASRQQAAGLGAIHFLEKPFPHGDFIALVEALLSPTSKPDSEKFQGTLSDLHLADIIQLKCMSGTSAALEFTGPQSEKARVYFESGQVRHATAPGKEGIAAFNEIVNWKGGKISEVAGAGPSPRTIDLDWQILLMEAVRKMDEERSVAKPASAPSKAEGRKILVIDDSLMLLSFVKEILSEAHYHVATAATAQEGLDSANNDHPDLILLDYVLPDMKGDEVSERLARDEKTTGIPIVYMSGFGADLQPDQLAHPNVIGSLNKPFTSDLLLTTVENFMPKESSESEATSPTVTGNQAASVSEPTWPQPEWQSAIPPEPTWPESASPEMPLAEISSPMETAEMAAAAGGASDAWWSAPVAPLPASDTPLMPGSGLEYPTSGNEAQAEMPTAAPVPIAVEESLPVTGTFFSGDTSFFSLNGALHTISKHRLTGILRAFWNNATVELLARNGDIVLATTGDGELYCPEAPITLVNVDEEQTREARAVQEATGCPLFLTLARQELILREPAAQLVEHYGQKLFAQLWTAPRVRFVFEQTETLPEYAQEIRGEEDIDHWILSTLRLIQSQDLVPAPETEANSIPAYTRDGFERVQKLRLTVAEAQFASQFNGTRSIAQIAKNLRLDFKFARLTLFRFLALEIVECWPPTPLEQPERRGFFQRMGFGE